MDFTKKAPLVTSDPPLFPASATGVFESSEDRNDFLNSLDPGTRDSIINCINDFSSKDELINYVNELHGNP